MLQGPGRKFVAAHNTHSLQVFMVGVARIVIIWILLIYPVSMRGMTRVLSCVDFKDFIDNQEPLSAYYPTHRMLINFDVVCGSAQHRRIVGHAGILQYPYLLLPPLIVFVVLFKLRTRIHDLPVRNMSAILFEGYKPQFFFWEALVVMRTGLVIWLSSIGAMSARTKRIAAVLVVSLVM